MKCPHCSIEFHDQWTHPWTGNFDARIRQFGIRFCTCPSCKLSTVMLTLYTRSGPDREEMIYPRGALRPIDSEVPDPYAADFREAVEVLPISPKASAALSRGNLQALLRDEHKVKHGILSKEIEEFIGRATTPSTLKEVVDAVRNIGNFAAHPTKDANTGALIAVEPHEAEWLLDVLDSMFDFTFVQPPRDKARKAALNAKLAAAGKQPMKP